MALQVDNDDLNAAARGQYDLRQTSEREVFLREHLIYLLTNLPQFLPYLVNRTLTNTEVHPSQK